MSYSRKDEAVMWRIAMILRKQGINVWMDNEKLAPGTPIWEEKIEKAIRGASALVVILSPDSKDSEWVRQEITLAEQHNKRIFPVLVRGDEDTSISIRLITSQYVDLRYNERSGLNKLSTALTLYPDELKTQTDADRISITQAKQEPATTREITAENELSVERRKKVRVYRYYQSDRRSLPFYGQGANKHSNHPIFGNMVREEYF